MNKFLSRIEKKAGVASKAGKFVKDLTGSNVRSMESRLASAKKYRYEGQGPYDMKTYHQTVAGKGSGVRGTGYVRVMDDSAKNKATSQTVKAEHKNLRNAQADRKFAVATTASAAGGIAAGAAASKYSSHEKKAALEQLLEDGYDFDSAIEAIQKEAGLVGSAMKMARGAGATVAGKARAFGTAMAQDAGRVGQQVNALKTGTGSPPLTGSRFKTPISQISHQSAVGELKGNKAIHGATGAVAGSAVVGAGIGAAMSNRQREKTACAKSLMEQGVSYDQAVSMVNEAADKLYGK